ncbi:MAG: IS21 family transposase [FCB group bacterium]|nr:IS21 family transposase [FCB group bacterium]
MANYLKMTNVQVILQLKERGWSNRRISRELGVNKDTVNRYVNQRKRQAESDLGPPEADLETVGLGSTGAVLIDSKPVTAPPGSEAAEISVPSGSTSRCVGYHDAIVSMIKQEFSAQRMYQDLVAEHNYDGSYYSVKRYVNKLRQVHILPFRRMECSPGMEAQVDFGSAAPIIMPNGKRKRSHAFRIVLSCSRKAYSECVFRQTTEAFLRCLENAFRHFGGVPQTLVIDNLRAAVSKADWYDPEVVPKLQSFCEHYGTVVLPAKPYTPRHKGKVESGVKYIKSNALKGKTFNSLNEQNEYLLQWERNIADKRIHGTTRRQVEKMFEEKEKPALKDLPADLFPSFEEAPRKVHRDGHVEIEKAYYSVPPEYFGRKVWARWDSRIVRIFDCKMQQISIHSKTEPGRFQTDDKHIHDRKRYGLEKGIEWLINKTIMIGPNAFHWAQYVIDVRGVTGQRSILGLLSLCNKHSRDEIDDACQKAISCGAYRLKSVRIIIEQNLPAQQTMEFIDEHPIIRDMSNYQNFIENRRTNQ